MRADEHRHSSSTAGPAKAGPVPAPAPAAQPPLLALQRTAGNAAVTRAIQLARHEHGPDCGHETVQRRAEAEPSVQRRSSLFDALSSPGVPLAPRLQQKAEQAYGTSFAHVRVHDGPVAQRSAEEFGARAYTAGADIVVGAQGADDETMFHEIDHVRQQSLGQVAGTDNGTGTRVSSPGDPFERAASDNGRRMAQGMAPDLAVPGSTAGSGATAQRTAVQRVQTPPRRSSSDYEADHESPGSSNYGRNSSPSSQGSGRGRPSAADYAAEVTTATGGSQRPNRYEFHDSSSDSEPSRRRPAAAPAPARSPSPPSSQLPGRVYHVVHERVTRFLTRAFDTEEEVAQIPDLADRAANIAAQVVEPVAATYPDSSTEADAFVERYTAAYRGAFQYEAEDLTDNELGIIAATALEQVEGAATAERNAESGGLIQLPQHPKLHPLYMLIMREQHRAPDKELTLSVMVDKGAPWLDIPQFLGEFDVGHVWLEVTTSDGHRTSFGFWPKSGMSLTDLAGSTEGQVKCPDGHAGDPGHAHETKKVGLGAVIAAYHVARRHADDKYSFLKYNCTSFGAEVWKAATGRDLDRGLMVSNPGSAAMGITQKQGERRDARRDRFRTALQGGPAGPRGMTQVGLGSQLQAPSALRGTVPGAGDIEEVADRMAGAHISQSSGTSSSENEVE
ncbi:DUF4157 domain-containing protein [Streptomyces sp. NPDC048278]|uniref:eCIS core domain-containing protein n=1 Tax=Streptomyces sp. NPDC048278 TaxID=3155809 RepID=UPI003442553E